MPYGLQAMLKEGHQHMSGMEEAVFRNIEACKQLSMITKTSMGPNGMPDDAALHIIPCVRLCNNFPVVHRHEQDGDQSP